MPAHWLRSLQVPERLCCARQGGPPPSNFCPPVMWNSMAQAVHGRRQMPEASAGTVNPKTLNHNPETLKTTPTRAHRRGAP